MIVRKEKQFLVFYLDDGSTVKYDFATKKAYGKSGREVRDLKSQLKGYSIEDIFDSCEDKKYAKFLKFVKDEYSRGWYDISNIGTILSHVPEYKNYEQLFSAGIDSIVGRGFSYTINDIPKGIIKLCKEHNIKLSNTFLTYYKQNPDAYLLAYKLDYISLTDADIYEILTKEFYIGYNAVYSERYNSFFNIMLNDYGYKAKPLLMYVDYLKTYEAIENMGDLTRELYDYVKMMNGISYKFDKYPRHFLTTHAIASRNYRRLAKQFEEQKFANRIDESLERTFGDYRFYYPKCTQDIKDESCAMSNCVASYVDRVIDGQCHILFLRLKDSPDKSLVTIEVRNKDGIPQIVQAKQKYNYKVTPEQQNCVDMWNKWQINKAKNIKEENESEEDLC